MPVFDPFGNSAAVQGSAMLNISDSDVVSTPGGKTLAEQYADYLTALNPLVWLRLRETSGTVAANSGSLAATADGTWTPGAGALGQTGKLGANEAYDYDGADSRISVPALAGINTLTAFTYAFLFKPDSPGESNLSYFCLTNGFERAFRINTSGYVLRCFVTATGTADSVTATGFIAAGSWVWLFATYDNAGDRIAHIYKGIAGAVTEAAYTTNNAATGTLANSSGVMNIGNSSTSAATLDGLLDEAMIFGRVLTPAEMLQIVTLTGN